VHSLSVPVPVAVPVAAVGGLILSNGFMAFVRCGHLMYKAAPLALVILVRWGIACVVDLLQMPANRMGHGNFGAAQIRTSQEVAMLTVFVPFWWLCLCEAVRWNHLVGLPFSGLGVLFEFLDWR
jgi:uncharacterized protein (DUF486 family)